MWSTQTTINTGVLSSWDPISHVITGNRSSLRYVCHLLQQHQSSYFSVSKLCFLLDIMHWRVIITEYTGFGYAALAVYVVLLKCQWSKWERWSSWWSYAALQIMDAWLWSRIQLLYGSKRHADLRSSIQSRNMSG